jgi:hypothetical protein
MPGIPATDSTKRFDQIFAATSAQHEPSSQDDEQAHGAQHRAG